MGLTNKKNPLVTIIIPTFNRAEITLNISIASVINQKYQNWGLIIVDDGSTDNSKTEFDNLIKTDARIKYLFQENKGQGAARNLGIKESKGDFILLLDSDDALLPDMISSIIKTFNDKIHYVASKRWVFNHKKGLFDVNGPNPSCVIYRKSIFENFGYFDENRDLIGMEDVDLFITWEINKKRKNAEINCIMIDKPLVIYLEHDNQETNHSDLKKLNNKIIAVIEKYKNIPDIPKKELSTKHKETGNFNLLLGNTCVGRHNLIKSLELKPNSQALILLLFSLFGKDIYTNFVINFKNFREKFIWKIRLNKTIKKYPELYKQAKIITSTYKDW